MKKVVLVILVAVLLLASVSIVYATLGNKTITITYRNISIYINGVKRVPSNEPFIYNGSTYVPLRFISEALNKEVKWDGTTNRIDINDKSQNNSQDDPIVYITKTGSKYHRAGCRYLSRSCIPIKRSVAIAQGYTPCSVCNPP